MSRHTEHEDVATLRAVLTHKAQTTRELRGKTGLSLPRIRYALRILESMNEARSVTVHYNNSGRGALAHAQGWVVTREVYREESDHADHR